MLLSPRLRALSVLPGALLARPTDVSRLTFTVRLWDVDLNVHLTNSRYPQFMDIGRLDLLLRAGTLQKMLSEGARPMVVESTIQFKKELRLGTTFTLESRVVGRQRRVVVVEQRFLVGDVEHAKGTIKALLARRGRIVDPVPFLPQLADLPIRSG